MLRIRAFTSYYLSSTYSTQKNRFYSRLQKFGKKEYSRKEGRATSIKNENDRSNRIESTQALLKKERTPYFDPANSSLDLTLDNKTLYNKIVKDAENRMEKRYILPSEEWLTDFKSQLKGLRTSKAGVKEEVYNCIMNSIISPDKAKEPVQVGDLVALHNDSFSLSLVVACPEKLDYNFYTYINSSGEIVYGPKQMIKLRIPGVIPKRLAGIFSSLVYLEKKYKDISPIGVADAVFSRSELSKPKQSETNGSNKKHKDATGSSGQLDDSDVGDDFIVAQASSQLLINTNVNTFHVPVKARALYSQALSALSLRAFEQMSEVTRKLEILHRALQFDANGGCHTSPVTVSVFELLFYLEKLNLNKFLKDSIPESLKKLRYQMDHSIRNELLENLCTRSGSKKATSKSFSRKGYNVSEFIAVLLALRNQSRLWRINQTSFANPLLSVTVIPINNVSSTSLALSFLKFQRGDRLFAHWVLTKLKNEQIEKPKFFDETIKLLRDYVSGNLSYDPAAETTIVSVIRLVDKTLQNGKLLIKAPVPHSYDYSKAKCYDILSLIDKDINNCQVRLTNPFAGSYALLLPRTDSLLIADFHDDYFNLLDRAAQGHGNNNLANSSSGVLNSGKRSLNEDFSKSSEIIGNEFYESDPLTNIRKNFGNCPIYCIDAPDAHEVDDGISISECTKENNFIITVHVANPTSYIRPTSYLSKIAFKKGSTTYLPEGASMMLPKFISKRSGLGESLETLTLAVQYKLNKTKFEEYMNRRSDSQRVEESINLLKAIFADIKNSVSITLFKASNFPKGFTYEKVDETLNCVMEKGSMKNYTGSDSSDAQNLAQLYRIALLLQDIRIVLGKGMDIGIPKSSLSISTGTGQIQNGLNKLENGYELEFDSFVKGDERIRISVKDESYQNESSKSRLLVSHHMIFANYCASLFASKNSIPLIRRAQTMNLEESTKKELNELVRRRYQKGENLSVEEVFKVLQVLAPAHMSTDGRPHEALGLEEYATVTSPLRRYVDMINHWKLQEFLVSRPEPCFELSQLNYMSNCLNLREAINKYIQSSSYKFWEGVFFSEYMKKLKNKEIQEPIKFALVLNSDPLRGNLAVSVLGFNNLKAKLECTPEIVQKFNTGEYLIGSEIHGFFNIAKLDYIEDELLFS